MKSPNQTMSDLIQGKVALIGYTGFVGSNLVNDLVGADLYNSKNINEIAGKQYDCVICAGVTAVKWWANKNAEKDLKNISVLKDALSSISANKFILISTVDVYEIPRHVTEEDSPRQHGLHAYGRNRLNLEEFVSNKFERHLIVRLPGLFGKNLKKNAIYDLLNRHRLSHISPRSVMQWYPIRRLGADLVYLAKSDIKIINISAEPILMHRVSQVLLPEIEIGSADPQPVFYDVWSLYSHILGRSGNYHISAAEIISELLELKSSYQSDLK